MHYLDALARLSLLFAGEGENVPHYKAIIFDMDGLMVDSEPLSHQAWNEFLRPFGHHIDNQLVQQMIGLRADASAQLVQEKFRLALPVGQIIKKKAVIHAQIRAQGVPPMPGLHQLHTAMTRRHIPWAVATSSTREHAVEILHQLRLAPTCDAIACGNDVSQGKPAPDIYLLAAKQLGIPPQLCIALEDSAPGSQAAIAAGLYTIAIPNEHTKMADFRHADQVLGSLFEVLAQLDTLI